jgi:hypothetical protein
MRAQPSGHRGVDGLSALFRPGAGTCLKAAPTIEMIRGEQFAAGQDSPRRAQRLVQRFAADSELKVDPSVKTLCRLI